MFSLSITSVATLLATAAVAEQFDALHHLGGQGPWFPAPNPNNISPDPPAGCSVDTAAFLSRHGARYPDPGAYSGWQSLYYKVLGLNPELCIIADSQ